MPHKLGKETQVVNSHVGKLVKTSIKLTFFMFGN